ncbi:hypothetical protein HFN12_14270 [Faecalicatena fissicatena]|uniref:hypothetical protein n=1 Tax=Faecalicatena fissicatena TaxID=290055 RepID=UPI0015710821|nr:hypothetical protein [Faecalicatena fissicatena]NSD83907.1 hypothetical protein [Faecalicatena fissicatena]
MNENTMNISEMEQELLTVRSKYKPYFELQNEVRKLKKERMEMLLKAESFLLILITMISVDLIYKFFIM